MSKLSEMMKERPKNIRIIGVGGAGINVAKFWRNDGGERADKFMAVCDWDAKALEQSGVSAVLKLGECKVWPGINSGAEAIEKSIDDARELVNANRVFIVAGLGGDFGTEAAPVLAREAKTAGATTFGIASLPFHCEGEKCARRAMDGLRDLAANTDGMFILNNESMTRRHFGDLLVPDAMARIDSIMSDSIDILTSTCMRDEPRWKNLDAKVVGIGRTGDELIDYLLKRKYRKKLLATFKPTNNNTAESGNMEPLQIILGDGKTPDLDGIMQYFGSQDSPVCVVADLGEEPEAKSAPFVARVARQMGATVVGLVILPAVSDGAAKCAKAIETLQNLAANAEIVYAYRSDIYSGISIGMMAYKVEDINYAVDRLINLIKEARLNESETQNKNGDADSRKVEAN